MSPKNHLCSDLMRSPGPVPETPVPPIGIGTGGTGTPPPPTCPPLQTNGTCPGSGLGRVGTGRDGLSKADIDHDVQRVLGALDYFGPLDVKNLAMAISEPVSLAISALDRAKARRLVTRHYPYWSLTSRAYSLAAGEGKKGIQVESDSSARAGMHHAVRVAA